MSLSLAWWMIGRDGGLSTLCHSWGFACQQKVLKTFPGPCYLCSENGVVWLWHTLLNLYIWLAFSSLYDSISLALWLIWRDGGLGTLCPSCWFTCQKRVLKTFPSPGYLHFKDRVVWRWHPLVSFYIWLAISSCYSSIHLALWFIRRDGGFKTLCCSCGFACQQKLLKMFPGPGYLRSEDGIVWRWHPLVNLYIWLAIWSCCDSIPFALWLIGRDGGLSTLCPSCGFACQQRMLKTFLGPGYLHSKDGVVRLWHPLVNLYIWLTILSC